MIKQIQILGMTFPNYSLRDELQLAQEALRSERLCMFLTMSMQSLMKVSSSGSRFGCVYHARSHSRHSQCQ